MLEGVSSLQRIHRRKKPRIPVIFTYVIKPQCSNKLTIVALKFSLRNRKILKFGRRTETRMRNELLMASVSRQRMIFTSAVENSEFSGKRSSQVLADPQT